MAICEIHLNAMPSLGRMVSVTACIPDGVVGPWATLYLLGGMTDDHTTWARRTSLERYASGLPLLIVMPDGGRDWYVNSQTAAHNAFETYVTRDLLTFVETTFHVKPVRQARAVAGLSMGGYGAMRLALGNPELYCAAVSHSGAMGITRNMSERSPEFQGEIGRIFGASPAGGPDDVFALAESLPESKRPALRLDCGVSDFLIEDNRLFHSHLNGLGYAHEYAEHDGGHDWAYWDSHIVETLAFVSGAMGLGAA